MIKNGKHPREEKSADYLYYIAVPKDKFTFKQHFFLEGGGGGGGGESDLHVDSGRLFKG